jgi:hypothetical protein
VREREGKGEEVGEQERKGVSTESILKMCFVHRKQLDNTRYRGKMKKSNRQVLSD